MPGRRILGGTIPGNLEASNAVPSGAICHFAGNSNPPVGWLFCDGSVIAFANYPALQQALFNSVSNSGAWGNGVGIPAWFSATSYVYGNVVTYAGSYYAAIQPSTNIAPTSVGGNLYWALQSSSQIVNLPDLRGRFVRGLDAGAGNDPDTASRGVTNAGGNSGDAVGSLQVDAITSHQHQTSGAIPLEPNAFGESVTSQNTGLNYVYPYGNASMPLTGSPFNVWGFGGVSSETRPRNAYCSIIIKI